MRVRQGGGVPQLWNAPAWRAMLYQCLALPVALCILAALEVRAGISLHPVAAALMQGGLAAALSGWRRLAVWWLPIQFFFPAALVGALSLRLPPSLFLGLFLAFMLLYWSSFRTQVPYYPSTRPVWRAIAGLLPARPLHGIDIGSGFGGFILELAALRPDCSFEGIELAPLPWLVSALRARWSGGRARFRRGDYFSLDFAAYDVVFAYLSPAAMPALWEKAHREMRPGSLLLSLEFIIPGHAPDLALQPQPDGKVLYGWRM